MSATLGLAVITKNEEKNIERCLRSVPFAKIQIVVDSLSTDQTVLIAEKLGAKIFLRKWEGYPKQKQFALEQVDADWILVLDADENLTIEAQEEIKSIIQNVHSCDAYAIPRYQVFMGRVLTHGKGFDHPLRLFKRGKGSYTSREVHEEILVNGTCGTLKCGMIHESSLDIMARYEKIKRDLMLEKQYVSSEKISYSALFVGPIRYFLSYFIKGGAWRDGVPGVIWLILFTFQIFLQNALQYEQSITQKPE
jgi:glycosyltransferase involved in cell wall biosynthesis